jgi:hypothetical protein
MEILYVHHGLRLVILMRPCRPQKERAPSLFTVDTVGGFKYELCNLWHDVCVEVSVCVCCSAGVHSFIISCGND